MQFFFIFLPQNCNPFAKTWHMQRCCELQNELHIYRINNYEKILKKKSQSILAQSSSELYNETSYDPDPFPSTAHKVC